MSHMPKTKNPMAMRVATTFTTTSSLRWRRSPPIASLVAGRSRGTVPSRDPEGVRRRSARATRSRPWSAPTRRRRGGRCRRARRDRGARAPIRRSRSSRPPTRTAWSTTCFAVSVARTFMPLSFAYQSEPWSTCSSTSRASETSCGRSASCAIAASAMRHLMSGSCESGRPSFFIEVRRRAAATARSSARAPMPAYTAREQQLEVREDGEDERVGVRPRFEAAHDAVGCRVRAVEHGRAALARPHADGVPVVEHPHVGILAVDEPVDDLRGVGRLGVEAHRAEARPRGRERREDLAARVAVAAVGLRFGGRAGAEQHEVVAGLADAEAEDLALAGLAHQELERVVAAVAQHLRDPRPHEVHVHRERRGGGGAGEPHLRAHGIGEAPAEAAEFLGHERAQVSGLGELGEVVVEERVVAVVPARARRGCVRAGRRAAGSRASRSRRQTTPGVLLARGRRGRVGRTDRAVPAARRRRHGLGVRRPRVASSTMTITTAAITSATSSHGSITPNATPSQRRMR